MTLAAGTQIAGYRIQSLLGRGGMGEVYLAEQVGLQRQVALKILSPAFAEDEGFRERFVRESQLAASLDHPNIVTVYDSCEADGRLFLAMRYIAGTDLGRRISRDGQLSLPEALDLLVGIASALD